MSSRIKMVAFALIFTAKVHAAEVSPFVLDPSVPAKGRTADRHIIAAHEPLPNVAGSAAARVAILSSLTGRPGEKFVFEGEGDGYVDARFDFKRNPLWLRIVYTDKLIQIRYLDGQAGFVCEINRDGICYKNHDNFYHYVAYLKKGIRGQLARLTKSAKSNAAALPDVDVDSEDDSSTQESARTEKP